MTQRPACRRCGRPVVWAETQWGRRVLLDPDPVPADHGGRYELDLDVIPLPFATIYRPEHRTHSPDALYACHYDTCPQKDQPRRRRRRRPARRTTP